MISIPHFIVVISAFFTINITSAESELHLNMDTGEFFRFPEEANSLHSESRKLCEILLKYNEAFPNGEDPISLFFNKNCIKENPLFKNSELSDLLTVVKNANKRYQALAAASGNKDDKLKIP